MVLSVGTALAAVLFAFAALLVYIRIAYRHRIALANKLPGPYTFPVIGNIYLVWITIHGFDYFFREAWRLSAQYPQKVAKITFMHILAVAVWHPADVEVLLSSSQHNEKANEYRFFKPWLGNGLLISSGETWRSHRRLIAPTFHLNVLKQFVHHFNRNSEELCRRLEAKMGHTVDVHHFLGESTVDTLLETAMGVDRSVQKNGSKYATAVVKLCGILHGRAVWPWLWSDSVFSLLPVGRAQKKLLHIVHGLTKDVLQVRRAERRAERRAGLHDGLSKRTAAAAEEAHTPHGTDEAADTGISYGQAAGLRDDLDEDLGGKKRVRFLDGLLDAAEDDKLLSDKEVEEEVSTIMFEGHDTLAAASSFFLCLMGVHPEQQQRCVDELRDIFGDSDRPATFQDTLEMKHLERCIMETLRLFPPVPLIARKLKEDVTLPSSGDVVPEGTTVVIGTFLLHRDAETYPEPSQFNPDNFLPERCAGRHYYAFIPFSAGPRSCVGRKYAMLKLKILLSTILRKMEVHADIPEKDFKLVGDIILKRKEGFPCRFVPRKRSGAVDMPGSG